MRNEYILAANILGAAIALTAGMVTWHRNRDRPRRMLMALVPLLLGFGLAIFGAISAYRNGLESAVQLGRLARSGTIAPSLRISMDGADRYVSIGNTLFCIADGDSMGFVEDGVPLLTLANVGGNVEVSAMIRDAHRGIVAQVIDNDWRHNPGTLWSHIADNGIYEITDGTGRVVLQLVHFGDAVSVQAILGLKRGEYLAFTDSVVSKQGTTAEYASLRTWPFGTSDLAIIRPLLDQGEDALHSQAVLARMRTKIVDGIMERICFEMGLIDVSPRRPSAQGLGPGDATNSNVIGLVFEAHATAPSGQPALSITLSSSPSRAAVENWKASNGDGHYFPSLSTTTVEEVIANATWTIEMSCEGPMFAKNVYCVVFDRHTGLYYLPKHSITTVAPGRPGTFLIGRPGKSREFFFERLARVYPDLSSSMLSVSTGQHLGYVLAMYDTPDGRGFVLKREFSKRDGRLQLGLPILFSQESEDQAADDAR